MATKKISALPEAATLTGAEDFEIVQSGDSKRVGIDTLFSINNGKWSGWIYPYTAGWAGTAGLPLTSIYWDGDAFVTTPKTLIDLSGFGVPAGVKAIAARIACRDSGSLATNNLLFGISPNNVASSFPVIVRPSGLPNDFIAEQSGVCPCDANGDIYYQIAASGDWLMDIWLEIWGYCL